MNIEEAFPSKYLKAADLKGQRVTVKMGRVEIENVGDEDKAVLYFIGSEKGLVLNVTNKNSIVELYGSDTDEWGNQPIMLYETKVQFSGRMVPAIRVDAPPRQRQAASPQARATVTRDDPRTDSDMVDDLPPF